VVSTPHAALWSAIAFAALGDGDTAAELVSMCNPINRSTTRAAARRYKVEPYAVAADIYGMAPHVGRGGWTWYTGSAAWMYRAGLEWIPRVSIARERAARRSLRPESLGSLRDRVSIPLGAL